jgi:Predicted hydrolase (HAD superfamily)
MVPKKPEGLKTLGEKLMEDPGFDPKMVLSVGDNYTNDIKISEILGFTTLYIDSYGSGYTGTMTVRKFREGISFIEKFLLTHK